MESFTLFSHSAPQTLAATCISSRQVNGKKSSGTLNSSGVSVYDTDSKHSSNKYPTIKFEIDKPHPYTQSFPSTFHCFNFKYELSAKDYYTFLKAYKIKVKTSHNRKKVIWAKRKTSKNCVGRRRL